MAAESKEARLARQQVDWAQQKIERERVKAWAAGVYLLAPQDRPFGRRGKYPKPPYKKDEHGHHLCRWCEVPLKGKGRWWCGEACVEAFLIRGDWKKAAAAITARDKVCQLCHGGRFDITRAHSISVRDGWPWRAPDWYPEACRLRVSWAVDHIVAVKDGGTDDPRNLRLLCGRCHSEVTAAQHARWAAERRRARHGEPALQASLSL